MRAREFIYEVTENDWDWNKQNLKKLQGQLDDNEIERLGYMSGKCAQLAIALHRLDPDRFTLGLMIEYFITVPDMMPDEQEWDELTPQQQADIKFDSKKWVLGHAYVYDRDTKEFIDARGRFKTQQEVQRGFGTSPKLGKTLFPATLKMLADVGTVEMTTTGVKTTKGQEYLEQHATEQDMKQALNFAQRNLDITI